MRAHALLLLLWGVVFLTNDCLATRTRGRNERLSSSVSRSVSSSSSGSSEEPTERLSRMAKRFGATSYEEASPEESSTEKIRRTTPRQHVKRLALAEDGVEYEVYQGVMGRPGVDFPVLPRIPKTAFSCRSVKSSGYYADLDTDCQVFHICDEGRKISFLCPNGTIFRQSHLICDWWWTVDCATSAEHYDQSAEQLAHDQRRYRARSNSYSNVKVFGASQEGEGIIPAEQRQHNSFRRHQSNNFRERQLPAETGSFVNSRGNHFNNQQSQYTPQTSTPAPYNNKNNYNYNNNFNANNNPNTFTPKYVEPFTVTPNPNRYQHQFVSKSYVQLDRSRPFTSTQVPTTTTTTTPSTTTYIPFTQSQVLTTPSSTSRRVKPVLVEVINRGDSRDFSAVTSTNVGAGNQQYDQKFPVNGDFNNRATPDPSFNVVSSTDGSVSDVYQSTRRPKYDSSTVRTTAPASTSPRSRRLRPVYVQVINRGTPKPTSTTENIVNTETVQTTIEQAYPTIITRIPNKILELTTNGQQSSRTEPDRTSQYEKDSTSPEFSTVNVPRPTTIYQDNNKYDHTQTTTYVDTTENERITNPLTEMPFSNNENEQYTQGIYDAYSSTPSNILSVNTESAVPPSADNIRYYPPSHEYSDELTNIDIYPPSGIPFTDEDIAGIGGTSQHFASSTTDNIPTVPQTEHSTKTFRVLNRGSSKFSTQAPVFPVTKVFQMQNHPQTNPTILSPTTLNHTSSKSLVHSIGRSNNIPTPTSYSEFINNSPSLASKFQSNRITVHVQDNSEKTTLPPPSTVYQSLIDQPRNTEQPDTTVNPTATSYPIDVAFTDSPSYHVPSTSIAPPYIDKVSIVNSNINSEDVFSSHGSEESRSYSSSGQNQLFTNNYKSTKLTPTSGIEIIERGTVSSEYPSTTTTTERPTTQHKYRKSFRTRTSESPEIEISTATVQTSSKGINNVQITHWGTPDSVINTEYTFSTESPIENTEYTLGDIVSPTSESSIFGNKYPNTDDNSYNSGTIKSSEYHEITSTTPKTSTNRQQPSRKPFPYSDGQRRRIISTSTTTPSLIQRALSKRLKTTPLPIPIRTGTTPKYTTTTSAYPVYVKSTTLRSISKILLPPNSLDTPKSYDDSTETKKTSTISVKVLDDTPETTPGLEPRIRGERPGLDIPPSSGPGTLHSLAVYFGTEETNPNTTNDEMGSSTVTSDITEKSVPNPDTDFTLDETNPTASINEESEIVPPTLLTKLTIDSYSSLFSTTTIKPLTTSETLIEDRIPDVSERVKISLITAPESSLPAREGRKYSLGNDENLTVKEGYSGTTPPDPTDLLIKDDAPGLRELAQVFSRALSAYLDDPDEFRKVLSEVRPTAPTNTSELESDLTASNTKSVGTTSTPIISVTYTQNNNDEDDEVLDFSDVSKAPSSRRLGSKTPKIKTDLSATYGTNLISNNNRNSKNLKFDNTESTLTVASTESITTPLYESESSEEGTETPKSALETLDKSQSSYYTEQPPQSLQTSINGYTNTIAIEVNNLFGTTSTTDETLGDYTLPPDTKQYTGSGYGAEVFSITAGGVMDKTRPRYGGFQNNSGGVSTEAEVIYSPEATRGDTSTARIALNTQIIEATTFLPGNRYKTKSSLPARNLIPPSYDDQSTTSNNSSTQNLGQILNTFIPEELNNLAVINSNIPTAISNAGLNPSSPGISTVTDTQYPEGISPSSSPSPYGDQPLVTAGTQLHARNNIVSSQEKQSFNEFVPTAPSTEEEYTSIKEDITTTVTDTETTQQPNISDSDESLVVANTARFNPTRTQNPANRWSVSRKWDQVPVKEVIVAGHNKIIIATTSQPIIKNHTPTINSKSVTIINNPSTEKYVPSHSSRASSGVDFEVNHKSRDGILSGKLQSKTVLEGTPRPINLPTFTPSPYSTVPTQKYQTSTQSHESISKHTYLPENTTESTDETTTQLPTTISSVDYTVTSDPPLLEGVRTNRKLKLTSGLAPVHTASSLSKFKSATGVYSSSQEETKHLIQIDGFSRMAISSGNSLQNGDSFTSITNKPNSETTTLSTESLTTINYQENDPATITETTVQTLRTTEIEENITEEPFQREKLTTDRVAPTNSPTLIDSVESTSTFESTTINTLRSETFSPDFSKDGSNSFDSTTIQIVFPTSRSSSHSKMIMITPSIVIPTSKPYKVTSDILSTTLSPSINDEGLVNSPSTYYSSKEKVDIQTPYSSLVSLDGSSSDMTPEELQSLENLQNMLSLDNATSVHAEKMFRTLNETSKTAFMDMMKQASCNSTVRRLVLLLVNQTLEDNTSLDEARAQLIDALLKHPEEEILSASHTTSLSESSTTKIHGDRRNGRRLDIGTTDVTTNTEESSTDIEHVTTILPQITTYRNRIRNVISTTEPYGGEHIGTPGILDKITSRSKTSLDELPLPTSSDLLRSRSASSGSVADGDLNQEADSRAIELLRSLYSLAARWG